MYKQFMDMFEPNGVVDVAFKTDNLQILDLNKIKVVVFDWGLLRTELQQIIRHKILYVFYLKQSISCKKIL